MDWASILGGLGSICSISSFVPQAWKVARTCETEALSTRMYILTVTGFAFWALYGVTLAAWPIIITNGTCLVLSAFILIMKLRSNHRASRQISRSAAGV